MELKRNESLTAMQIEAMAKDAIGMMPETNDPYDDNLVTAWQDGEKLKRETDYSEHYSQSVYQNAARRMSVPADIAPTVIAMFKENGYFVYCWTDACHINNYYVHRRRLSPETLDKKYV